MLLALYFCDASSSSVVKYFTIFQPFTKRINSCECREHDQLETNEFFFESKCVKFERDLWNVSLKVLKSHKLKKKESTVESLSCQVEKQTIIQEAMNFPHYSLSDCTEFILYLLDCKHIITASLRFFSFFRFFTSNSSFCPGITEIFCMQCNMKGE